jgi:hypothetical protein
MTPKSWLVEAIVEVSNLIGAVCRPAASPLAMWRLKRQTTFNANAGGAHQQMNFW